MVGDSICGGVVGDRVSGVVVRDSVSGGVMGDSISIGVEGESVGGEGRVGVGGSVVVNPLVLGVKIARKIYVSFTFLTCMNSVHALINLIISLCMPHP